MDSTKTSDNKLTFLHILARAVSSKFPETTSFADELNDVKEASRGIKLCGFNNIFHYINLNYDLLYKTLKAL